MKEEDPEAFQKVKAGEQTVGGAVAELVWGSSVPAADMPDFAGIRFEGTKVEGYVYILSNPSMPADTLKIGMTTNSPDERAKELQGTGVPTPFEVELSFKVKDCAKSEAAIHRELRSYRVRDNREFFEVDLRTASAVAQRTLTSMGEIIEVIDPKFIAVVAEARQQRIDEAARNKREEEAAAREADRKRQDAQQKAQKEAEYAVRLRQEEEGIEITYLLVGGLVMILMLGWGVYAAIK